MPKSKPKKSKRQVKTALVLETSTSDNTINPSKQDSNLVSGDFLELKSVPKSSFWVKFNFLKRKPSNLNGKQTSNDYNNLSDVDKVLISMNQKLEKSTTNFQHLIYFVVFLVISMQISIFWVVQKPQLQFNLFQNDNQAKTTGIEKQALSKDYDNKSIDSFSGNGAIVDLGSNVNAKQKYIEVRKVPDCQTQVVPSPESGCGFSILTTSLGLSDPGIILRSIRFNADIEPEDKLDIAIKNFEKGTVSQSIATINKKNLATKTPLPSFLSPVESLYIRFWAGKNQPRINQITIEYSSVNKLKEISGGFDTSKIANQKGFIYADEDENGQLSKSIDLEWKCQLGFPGVKIVEIDEKSAFKILRDDECYTGPKAPNWNGDDLSHSLPAGKWLLVVNDKPYPFEIKTEDENVNLSLIDE